MRRVVVLALLALALPMAAWANGIDMTNQYGSISISAAGITSTVSQLKSFNGIVAPPAHALGSVSFTVGPCLTNCGDLAAGNSLFSSVGSSFDVTSSSTKYGLPKGTLFSGSFVGPVSWTLVSPPGVKNLVYTITGSIAGMLYTGRFVSGTTTQTVYSVAGQLSQGIGHIRLGNTHLVVPEPGTLGLLGTGLVGIAGMFRRKIFGA